MRVISFKCTSHILLFYHRHMHFSTCLILSFVINLSSQLKFPSQFCMAAKFELIKPLDFCFHFQNMIFSFFFYWNQNYASTIFFNWDIQKQLIAPLCSYSTSQDEQKILNHQGDTITFWKVIQWLFDINLPSIRADATWSALFSPIEI